MRRQVAAVLMVFSLAGPWVAPASAQAPLPVVPEAEPPSAAAPSPPSYPPEELERIVSPIALYPDPLLAQVLAAATFADQIPEAARWANEHHYLKGSALTAAMAEDQLPWDPSVQALVPFPSVLGMMASDMPWTQELGDAFLAQRADVMDAVQRQRLKAEQFGYLRSNAQVTVTSGPYCEILPVRPDFLVVPYYDPAIVFAAPRRGFVVAGAIRFGFGITLGAAFAPWGWATSRFVWGERAIVLNGEPWRRGWVNRRTYVHPYAIQRHTGPRPAERHRLIGRSPREREAERSGRPPREEHHRRG